MPSPPEDQRTWLAALARCLRPAALGLAVALAPEARTQDGEDLDFSALSLEELMTIQVEVTSVSRKAEAVSDTPAAVTVISAEDIRRSGATSLPEALRLAPGVHVARVNSSSWAVGIRGFNGQFSNKLLVLIDGRSVYTPVFSGVYWDAQDVMLEDVDRIEVIRGPGSVAWGANATNGVINVITKDAARTQGSLASLTVGETDTWILSARHGGRLGEDGHYRAWARGASRDSLPASTGGEASDDWRMASGGFRYDAEQGEDARRSVQAGAYSGTVGFDGRVGSVATPPFAVFPTRQDVDGAHLLGRWDWGLADDEDLTFQAWVDTSSRNGDFGRQEIHIGDLELTHRRRLGDADDLVWGVNYRVVASDMRNSPVVGFLDPERVDRIASAFVSVEHELLPDELYATVGAKLEDTSAGGTELMPNLRMRYSPTASRTFWGAVSRGVRTPSLAERSVVLDLAALPPPPVTTLTTLVGSDTLENEHLTAFELGWREELDDGLSLDLATFRHEYDDLLTTEPGLPAPIAPGVFQVVLTPDNRASGTSQGAELGLAWDVRDDWELDAAYTWLDVDVDVDAGSGSGPSDEDDRAPRQIAHLRSHHVLDERTDLDLLAWYVDGIDALGVDSYVRMDANITRRFGETTSIQVGVANLFHDDEAEWGDDIISTASLAERTLFLRLTHRF